MRVFFDKYNWVVSWFAMALSWLAAGAFVYVYCPVPWELAFCCFQCVISSVNAYLSYSKIVS